MLARCIFHITLPLFFIAKLTSSDAFSASPNPSPQVAGHIDSIDCTNLNGYELKRNGVAVRRESQLRDGDAITITDPKCKMTISIPGSIRTLSIKDGTYTVQLSRISLIDRIRYVLGYSDGHAGVGIGIGAGISRADGEGAELAIPLLTLWENQLAAGTRTLRLAWRDGEGPFEVIVAMEGKENAPLARTSNIPSRSIQYKTLTLQPGTYLVTIRGANGRAKQASFEVVNPSQIPTPPAELHIDRSDRQILQAGWLASTGHGEFVLEAYQRLSALETNDSHVSRIQERLEAGWRPRLK